MTLTVEIPPDLVPALWKAAVRTGQAPEAFASDTLVRSLRADLMNSQDQPLSWEDFEAAMDELDIQAPVLAPDATSREALYADHD